jgi:hypothetical protein
VKAYALCSTSLLPGITVFTVQPRVGTCYHAALLIEFQIDAAYIECPTGLATRKRKRDDDVLPDETELDKRLIQTLAAGKDKSKRNAGTIRPGTPQYNSRPSGYLWSLQKSRKAYGFCWICRLLR